MATSGDGSYYTEQDIENAAADARYLVENSVIIQKLVAVDIISRRIFLHTHGAMIQEINQGWEVQYPELVLKTLGMSAQEKAVAEPSTPTELHQQLFESVLPFIEILIHMEKDRHGQTNLEDTGNPVVPGSDPCPPE